MKHINEFVKFDFEKWSEGKKYRVTNISPWFDKASGVTLGQNVEVVILEDNCPNYRLKDGESFSMIYDKVVFKATKNNAHVGDFVKVSGVSPVVYANNGFLNVSFRCGEVSPETVKK